jgi:hypothetical protein
MFSSIRNTCQRLFNHINDAIKKWTKPATVTLAVGTVCDMTRSYQDMLVKNAILRQQLAVLKRPQFTAGDRTRLTLLARLTNHWHSALHIVQPDTILRRHPTINSRAKSSPHQC